ncbi:uncharacterized protein L201_003779 [Kwoniella dendrophila CBS 6074]|uniref:Uncharacterized protein n=1 Tax=Kwoniella dendrophila CBS 6074 TaxID=1295534 RepID=A0AAX4JVD6_9TREE
MITSFITSTIIGSWWLSHIFGLVGPLPGFRQTLLRVPLICDMEDDNSSSLMKDIGETTANLDFQGLTCLEFCGCYQFMYENKNFCQCSNELPPPYIWYITSMDAHSNCNQPDYNVTFLEEPNQALQGCTSGSFLYERLSIENKKEMKIKMLKSKTNRKKFLELMDLMSIS